MWKGLLEEVSFRSLCGVGKVFSMKEGNGIKYGKRVRELLGSVPGSELDLKPVERLYGCTLAVS
jgi:hypothetical protein